MMHLKKSAPKQKLKEFSFQAIGTHWRIEYGGINMGPAIEQTILKRIELFDKTYSRFRNDSIVAQMARQAGTYKLPDDAVELFDFYEQLYTATAGAVTPLVGNTLSDAGYDAEYSLRFKKKTVAPSLADTYSRKNNVITMHGAALLDIGAAGKGYLVGIICRLLKSCGATSMIVDAGGDIAVLTEGTSSTEIALQHPVNKAEAVGVASVVSGSLCGSSIYLRNWGSHHHIIDPRTAVSPTHIQAIWVYAQSSMLADGLSTALFFTEPSVLSQYFNFEYAIMKADDSLLYSPQFPATFFE